VCLCYGVRFYSFVGGGLGCGAGRLRRPASLAYGCVCPSGRTSTAYLADWVDGRTGALRSSCKCSACGGFADTVDWLVSGKY
jgi:hypothetical protein